MRNAAELEEFTPSYIKSQKLEDKAARVIATLEKIFIARTKAGFNSYTLITADNQLSEIVMRNLLQAGYKYNEYGPLTDGTTLLDIYWE